MITTPVKTRYSTIKMSAFDLSVEEPYRLWRDEKLDDYPTSIDGLTVSIADSSLPDAAEQQAIFRLCEKTNMALYKVNGSLTKQAALDLAKLFGLRGLDVPLYTIEPGVTEIENVDGGRQGEYAPYTARALSGHTDGYYNTANNRVLGMVLHCERAALDGGITSLLDPEIAYIRLRDENPDYIAALMQPDALTIPENVEGGKCIRQAVTGPVFSVINGFLHMRYTARKRYVEWKQDPVLTKARGFLTALLEDPNGPVLHHKMTSGEGLINNNVLHTRSAFKDGPESTRLLYRARFKSRVSKRQLSEINGDC